MRWH